MGKDFSFSETIVGGLCWNRLTLKRMKEPLALENFGYKVYSQNDEDGIIHEIFKRIGTETKEFVELGVGNGLECNTHYLLHCGWHGLWIEGSKASCRHIESSFRPVMKNGRLKVINAFITREKTDRLISENRNSNTRDTSPDFLSIDIDGNDWYVWEAVKSIRPRLVCIEYNGKFPPDISWKQAYYQKHIWDGSDWQGASLKEMERLGRKKGYVLVCTNLNGVNAFFVREDLYSKELFLFSTTAEELYNPYRQDLKFVTPGHPARYCLADQEENKGLMNYFKDNLEFKRAQNERRRNKVIKKLKKICEN